MEHDVAESSARLHNWHARYATDLLATSSPFFLNFWGTRQAFELSILDHHDVAESWCAGFVALADPLCFSAS